MLSKCKLQKQKIGISSIIFTYISQDNLPNELYDTATTIEYETLNEQGQTSPAFLFVIDTAISESELNAIKTSIQQALSLLPLDSMVGLITFGQHVLVHEIGFELCSKSIVFRGDK